MADVVSTGLTALAVVLFGLALIAMTGRNLVVAGTCFLSASIVIYLRETRLQDEETAG